MSTAIVWNECDPEELTRSTTITGFPPSVPDATATTVPGGRLGCSSTRGAGRRGRPSSRPSTGRSRRPPRSAPTQGRRPPSTRPRHRPSRRRRRRSTSAATARSPKSPHADGRRCSTVRFLDGPACCGERGLVTRAGAGFRAVVAVPGRDHHAGAHHEHDDGAAAADAEQPRACAAPCRSTGSSGAHEPRAGSRRRAGRPRAAPPRARRAVVGRDRLGGSGVVVRHGQWCDVRERVRGSRAPRRARRARGEIRERTVPAGMSSTLAISA